MRENRRNKRLNEDREGTTRNQRGQENTGRDKWKEAETSYHIIVAETVKVTDQDGTEFMLDKGDRINYSID